MRGITFVLVPTLSLVNMGVHGASIGNILGQRGDGAKLGATTQAARQYHTADFSNSDSHKGAVAHRALLDTLTQSTALPSSDPGNSTTTVQSVSPRVDVGQNEVTALAEDVQNVASLLPRQLSLDAPSLTNSLAPNTISSGDGLTSLTGVDSLRRAENAEDNAAVCSKHKASLDTRALEITKTSAADPVDISNIDGGLALRAQHARQVPAPIAGLPVVGPVIAGAVPRSVDARALELLGIVGDSEMIDSVIDNAVRDLTITPTLDHKPLLGEADLASGTLPSTSDINTAISGLKGSSTPVVGAPASILGGPGLPILGSGASPISALGSNLPVVGGSGSNSLPILGGGSSVPVVGSSTGNAGSNSLPILGGSDFPVRLPSLGESPISSGSGTGTSAPLGITNLVGATRRQVDTDTAEADVETAQGVADEIVENTARGLTDMLNGVPLLGSRTVKRDASITLDALQPSLTALFVRQEDTTSDTSDDTADSATDSGGVADSTDEGTSSTDAATVARRQTSDSADGSADSADGTDATDDSTDSVDSVDDAGSADASDSSDATTTATRRQATDESSDASDSGDATGDSTDSSEAGDASDSSDAAIASVTRRQSTDDSADATDSTTGEATDSADSADASGSTDADATASATRRQTTDESTDTSDSSDASGDATDSTDSGDVSGSDSSEAATVTVTRRQTTDDSTGASDSSDAGADSTDAADSGDASDSDSSDATVAAARRQTTDDSTEASGSSDTSGDSGADSAETSGDSTDAGDGSDAIAAVGRRQDTSDDGSSTSDDATANNGDDASTSVSAGGDEPSSTDGIEDAAARRRALGFKLTPSKLRNRMTLRKVRRQDNVDIDDADVDASESTDVATDAATDVLATEESLDSLD